MTVQELVLLTAAQTTPGPVPLWNSTICNDNREIALDRLIPIHYDNVGESRSGEEYGVAAHNVFLFYLFSLAAPGTMIVGAAFGCTRQSLSPISVTHSKKKPLSSRHRN
jgi:hypothetical protein